MRVEDTSVETVPVPIQQRPAAVGTAAPRPMPERLFMILPSRERNKITKVPRRDRRSWQGILSALIRGNEVFVPEEEINDDGKYLRTALGRRGKGESLRTMVDVQDMVLPDGTIRESVEGRRLWIEKD